MSLQGMILLPLTLLSAAACSDAPRPTVSYAVAIAPSFAADQAGSIVAGLDEWKAAVPEFAFEATIAECTPTSAHDVCIRPAFDAADPSANLVGATYPSASGAAVVLYVNRIQATGWNVDRLIQQTTAHEMGHVMGLRHSAAGELMAARVPDQAHCVTPADVAQFWSMRGAR